MKRILRIIAEYVEEWDENEDPELNDYTFEDWEDCDWDNVGRPLERMEDTGWKIIRKKKLIKE